MNSLHKRYVPVRIAPLIGLFLGFFLLGGTVWAAGPTVVDNDIHTSTTWTKSGSPYIVGRDIMVLPGATLTIQPGTTVLFKKIDAPKTWSRGASLRVLGNLTAHGTLSEPITFSLYESREIGGWGGLWIDGMFGGGNASLEHVRVEYADRGVYASGSAVRVHDSLFTDNFTAIHIENAQGFEVKYTGLTRGEFGINIDSSSGVLEYNTIVSNSWGVYIFNGQGIDVVRNDIKSNTFGIVYDGGAGDEITYNDFSVRNSNDYVILLRTGKPDLISHNNFYFDPAITNNPNFVFWFVFNEANNGIVNAKNNYWSATSTAFIDYYIYDQKDAPWVGLVDYEPWSNTPVAGTIDDLRPPDVHILARVLFSPNGDGIQDVAAIPYSLSEDSASVHVSIVDSSGILGTQGAVLWNRVYTSTGPHAQNTRDGTHTITWDGKPDGSGTAVPEGVYTVRIEAYDMRRPETFGVGEREIVVDVTPPQLEVLSPAHQSTTALALHDVTGRAKDNDTLGLAVRVDGRPTFLTPGTEGWVNFSAGIVLTDIINTIPIQASDGAGNTSQFILELGWDRKITIDLPPFTGQELTTVQGDVTGELIHTLTARRRNPTGTWSAPIAADITGSGTNRSYATSATLLLERGHNLVLVEGFDSGGTLIASAAAWVEFDPFAGKTIDNTFAPGLRMITVPMTPDIGDAATALGLPSPLRLARWQATPQGARYVFYEDEPGLFQMFQPGRGYWLDIDPAQFPSGHAASVDGRLQDTGVDAEIPLSSGWNQIGNPFEGPVNWQSVLVQLPGGRPVAWQSAVNLGWLRASLWGFDGNGYVLSNSLQPWRGYWVKTTRDLSLIITPSSVGHQGASAGVQAQSAGRMSALSLLAAGGSDPGGWNLRLRVASEFGSDTFNIAGVSPQATAGFDPFYDAEKAPPFGGGPRLYFPSDEVGALAVDIRGTDEGPYYRWPVVLTVDQPGVYELTWSGASSLPGGSTAYLVDESTGRRVDMMRMNRAELDLQEAGVYPLAIEVLSAGEVTVSGILVYPNPASLLTPVRVRFHVTGQARVSSAIYDTAGRLVRSLPQQVVGPGTAEVSWDGRTRSGVAAANGLYFVVLNVEAGGSRQRHTARVAVLK